MEQSPLETLLGEALEQCAQDFPEAKRKLDAFNAALEHIDERDEHGNFTRRAHDSRHYLRSELLDMRPYKRAKREVEKQLRKARAKAESAISKALVAHVVYHQWKLEYDLLSDKDDGTKLVPRSREEHTRDSIARIAEPFVMDLIARGVTPSAIARRRASEADTIALLVQWGHDDPDYENPENPWLAAFDAGICEAYRTGMSENGARLLDLAMGLRDEKVAKLIATAREFLPEELSVSTGVAVGAARLMEAAHTLPDGLAQAYADAFDLVRESDIERIGKLLSVETDEDRRKLQVLVNFIRQQEHKTYPDLPTWLEIDVMRRVIDTAHADTRPAHEWVGDVTDKLSRLAEIFGDRLNSEDAFYALLHAAMRSSQTHARFEEQADARASKDAELVRLRSIRDAVIEGHPFKLDRFGYPVREGEDGYENSSSEIFTVTTFQPVIRHDWDSDVDAHGQKPSSDIGQNDEDSNLARTASTDGLYDREPEPDTETEGVSPDRISLTSQDHGQSPATPTHISGRDAAAPSEASTPEQTSTQPGGPEEHRSIASEGGHREAPPNDKPTFARPDIDRLSDRLPFYDFDNEEDDWND